ncbi:MAG TPA: chemotaxis response regulator protein-glutamate methylesterase [Phototrophicaceae bacterium]|jgi:two-component system chemotaxis response regulator CheB|nr:chemotaxis response regulator protein-glutamate methylesterase [Phototrophicaceae bacterium]
MITPTASVSTAAKKIRVMVVDDSAVIRAVIARTLNATPDIEVVGVAKNGQEGVDLIKKLQPDIVVLDIEMPIMDGITALPLLLKEKPDARILICSTLSAHGAEISIKALSLGATECILKPGGDAILSAEQFQENLVGVIRTLGSHALKKPVVTGHAATIAAQGSFTLRSSGVQSLPPTILAIGSSTGGPKALMEVLKNMNDLPVPIVVTQHMPKTFTTLLAQHINQNCKIPASEGAEGMVIKKGHVYIAPGGYHMVLKKRGEDVVISINEDAPENFCRPSVNPMLRSLIPIYGGRILTVILTGMGNDGSQVCKDVVEKGGQVIAQDEATSVVWGMPGAVATAGLCTAVLPLQEINGWIKKAIK